MVCAKLFAYCHVWLPVFTRMCHQCVEKQAMTPPRGPMDAQTDPRSSPTEPKRGPNKPQHEHHEFPKLSHVRPEVSKTMVSHGLYMLLCSTALVHPHAAPVCPETGHHSPKCTMASQSQPKQCPEQAPTSASKPPNHLHFESHNYRHPSNQ